MSPLTLVVVAIEADQTAIPMQLSVQEIPFIDVAIAGDMPCKTISLAIRRRLTFSSVRSIVTYTVVFRMLKLCYTLVDHFFDVKRP